MPGDDDGSMEEAPVLWLVGTSGLEFALELEPRFDHFQGIGETASPNGGKGPCQELLHFTYLYPVKPSSTWNNTNNIQLKKLICLAEMVRLNIIKN
jgi:hypothetical protein